jgi:hypothetical protein
MLLKRLTFYKSILLKMKSLRPILMILAFACLSYPSVQAQIDPNTVPAAGNMVRITMTDGSVYLGEILSQEQGIIRLKTTNLGTLQVPTVNIERLEDISGDKMRKGQYWFENPSYNRYFLGQSAQPLRKGEGYYQNIWVFFNSAHYGITKNIAIGGGFEFLSTFAAKTPIFFLSAKAGFPFGKRSSAGATIRYLNIADFSGNDDIETDLAGGVFLGTAQYTYGTSDHNLTAGIGYGVAGKETADRPVFVLSGQTRVGKRMGLMTENYIVPVNGVEAIFIYGMRFMGERISFDLVFLNHPEIAKVIFIGIPMVDFVFKFGK